MSQVLKTFICSISAIQIGPGIITDVDRGVLICEVDSASNSPVRFAAAVAHLPLLLVRYEAAEAKDYALQRARELFPEADGWCNHAAVMIEIPRSTFIQMQLFITVREAVHRLLVFVGFKKSAA